MGGGNSGTIGGAVNGNAGAYGRAFFGIGGRNNYIGGKKAGNGKRKIFQQRVPF